MLDLTIDASEILAASPYVTEGRLFKKCSPKVASLYTDFNALSFISGASNLRILKLLLEKGVAIYHVDFLHAKVVMINGEHFSLGSQNLTVRSRSKNIEASFVGGHDTPAREVRDFFERIHKNARSISIQDIAEMEELVDPWIKKFKELDKAAGAIDDTLAAARNAHEEERRRRAESRQKMLAEAQKRSHQGLMRQAIIRATNLFNKSPNSLRIIAKVKRIENEPADRWRNSTFTRSLVPKNRENFMELISSSGVIPVHLSRYLMINLDNGKLAYARLAGGRISYFASGLCPNEKFWFQTHSFNVQIRFERNPEFLKTRNVVVELVLKALGPDPVGSVDFAFSVDGLEFHQVHVVSRLGSSARLLTHHVVECALRSEELAKFVRLWLTKQFKFTKNLYGENAAQYFRSEASTNFEIKAIRFKEKVILSAREYPYPTRPVNVPDVLRKDTQEKI